MSDSPPSAGLLARNTVFNVGANVLPLLAGVFAIPFLVSRMGTERFSLLLLAMTIIGYCIIFDLGTGRALTKLTAELVGAGRRREIPILVST